MSLSPEEFRRLAQHLRTRWSEKHAAVDTWYEREIRSAEERLEQWHLDRYHQPIPESPLVSIPGRAAPVMMVKALLALRRTRRAIMGSWLGRTVIGALRRALTGSTRDFRGLARARVRRRELRLPEIASGRIEDQGKESQAPQSREMKDRGA